VAGGISKIDPQPVKITKPVETTDNSVNLAKLGSGINNFTNPGMGATHHYHYTLSLLNTINYSL